MKIGKELIILISAIAVAGISYPLYFKSDPLIKDVPGVEKKEPKWPDDYRIEEIKTLEPTTMEEYRKSPFAIRLEKRAKDALDNSPDIGAMEDWYFETFAGDSIKDFEKLDLYILNCKGSEEEQEVMFNNDCLRDDTTKLHLISISWKGGQAKFIAKEDYQIGTLGNNRDNLPFSIYRPYILTKRVKVEKGGI